MPLINNKNNRNVVVVVVVAAGDDTTAPPPAPLLLVPLLVLVLLVFCALLRVVFVIFVCSNRRLFLPGSHLFPGRTINGKHQSASAVAGCLATMLDFLFGWLVAPLRLISLHIESQSIRQLPNNLL